MKRFRFNCKECFNLRFSEMKDYVELHKDILCQKGVYALINKKEDKIYVGSTVTSLGERLFINGSSHAFMFRRNKHRFINNDNIEDFECLILEYGKIDVRDLEKKYVMILKSCESEYGYNLTTTGGFGSKLGNKTGIKNLVVQTNKLWVTDGVSKSFKIDGIENIPKGYYPGNFGISYCKNLNDEYHILDNRNHQSDPVIMQITRSEAKKFCLSNRV